MRHLTGTMLLMIGVLASGACSSAAATTPVTTPATTPVTPVTTAPTSSTDQATGAVDPGMVLSGEDVVTSAEVDAATEAAANG